MEIEYTLGKHDWIAYWMYGWDQSPAGRRPLLKQLWRILKTLLATAWMTSLPSWFLIIVFLWAQEMAGERHPLGEGYLYFALFVWLGVFLISSLVIFCTPSFWANTRSAYQRRVKRHLADHIRADSIRLARRYHVRFEASGFIEITEFHESEREFAVHERTETHVPWQMVRRIDLGKGQAFFIVPTKGALIVPWSAFPDRPAFLQFIDQTKELWRKAILASAPEIRERQEQVTQTPAQSMAIPLPDVGGSD